MLCHCSFCCISPTLQTSSVWTDQMGFCQGAGEDGRNGQESEDNLCFLLPGFWLLHNCWHEWNAHLWWPSVWSPVPDFLATSQPKDLSTQWRFPSQCNHWGNTWWWPHQVHFHTKQLESSNPCVLQLEWNDLQLHCRLWQLLSWPPSLQKQSELPSCLSSPPLLEYQELCLPLSHLCSKFCGEVFLSGQGCLHTDQRTCLQLLCSDT